jgi:cyclohexanecarboxyl-CoA dehydrogenase
MHYCFARREAFAQMPLDFAFSEEQELFRRVVRDFCEKEIAPKIKEFEKREEYPWEIVRKMAQAGLVGIGLPKQYGGQEADSVTQGIYGEELARGGGILPPDAFAGVLASIGSDELKRKWLPGVCTGDHMLGLASTEPGTGSDVASIQATAVKKGNEYVINGEKQCVSWVKESKAFMVLCKTQPEAGARGISMILVEMDQPGVDRYYFKTLGWRTDSLGGFTLKDVHVPTSNLVGQENFGFVYTMLTFDYARVLLSLWCLGHAQASLDGAIEYARQRKAFGQPIGKFESVQFRLAEDHTLLEAARLLCYKTLWMRDRGLPASKECAMAKWWVPQVAFQVVNNAIQVHGAIGYTTEYPDEWRLRQVRGAWIADGTPDIMKIIIARELLGKEFIPYR